MSYDRPPGNLFTPSNYSGTRLPNSEVNWAQLAQSWIQHHHQAYPPPPPPPSAAPSAPTQQFRPQNYAQAAIPSLFPSRAQAPSAFFPNPIARPAPPHQDQWGGGHRPTAPPYWGQQPAAAQSMAYPSPLRQPIKQPQQHPYVAGESTSDQQAEEEEYQAHYHPSLEQEDTAEVKPPSEIEMIGGVPAGAMQHWMIEPMWAGGAAYPANFMPVIDMQMRKKLPAWILEGLEKAEKEKQKKLEKEELEKRQKELEEQRRKKRAEKGLGKFDSDSEDEESLANEEAAIEKGVAPVRQFREFVDPPPEEEDTRTEEERREQAVLVMRRLMTTVLLDTTNREFERVAERVLAKEKDKAQPKILAKSSALAALQSSLDEEDEEEEEAAPEQMAQQKETKMDEPNASEMRTTAVNGGQKAVAADESVFKVPLAPQMKRAQSGQQDVQEKVAADHVDKDEKDPNHRVGPKDNGSEQKKERKRKSRDKSSEDEDNEGRSRKDSRKRKSRDKTPDRDRRRDRDRSPERERERRDRNRSPERERRDRERRKLPERDRHGRDRSPPEEGRRDRERSPDDRRRDRDRREKGDDDLPAQYKSSHSREERERDRKRSRRSRSRSRSPPSRRSRDDSHSSSRH